MDFKDYTNILASTGIITWEQAGQITEAIQRLEDVQATRVKALDDQFFEDEGRYGSS